MQHSPPISSMSGGGPVTRSRCAVTTTTTTTTTVATTCMTTVAATTTVSSSGGLLLQGRSRRSPTLVALMSSPPMGQTSPGVATPVYTPESLGSGGLTPPGSVRATQRHALVHPPAPVSAQDPSFFFALMAQQEEGRRQERREERRMEEERRHEERAEAERLRQLELVRAEQLQQRSEQLRREERAEAEIIRQEEREERRIERETREFDREQSARQMTELLSRASQPAQAPIPRAPQPKLKMPMWRPEDDVDEFLQHFEATAEVYGLSESIKLQHLSSGLTGKAREAFNNLPPSSSYADLVAALRKKFRLTPEAYRKKFRGMRKEGSDSFLEFGVKLRRTMGRWVTLSGWELEDLVLLEQLTDGVSGDLAIHIREGEPKNFEQAIRRAEVYAEARRVPRAGNSPQKTRTTVNPATQRSTPSSMGPKPSVIRQESQPSGLRAATQKPVTCYYCGDQGHIKRECPKLKRDQQSRGAAGTRRGVRT